MHALFYCIFVGKSKAEVGIRLSSIQINVDLDFCILAQYLEKPIRTSSL